MKLTLRATSIIFIRLYTHTHSYRLIANLPHTGIFLTGFVYSVAVRHQIDGVLAPRLGIAIPDLVFQSRDSGLALPGSRDPGIPEVPILKGI